MFYSSLLSYILHDIKNEIIKKIIDITGKSLKNSSIVFSEGADILNRVNSIIITVGTKAIATNTNLALSAPNLYNAGIKKPIIKRATITIIPVLKANSSILILFLVIIIIHAYIVEIITPNTTNNKDSIYLLSTILFRVIGKDAAYLSHLEYSS